MIREAMKNKDFGIFCFVAISPLTSRYMHLI